MKYNCPGCPPGGLCPPFYNIFLENFDARTWEVGIFTRDGNPVQTERVQVGKTLVLSFRPSHERFKAGSIGDYELVFATKTGNKRVSHRIKTRLELGEQPYRPKS